MYEDEDEMGEAINHYWAIHLSFGCLTTFLKEQHPDLRVFANLNCHYTNGPVDSKSKSLPYFSADLMIVRPHVPCPDDLATYTIGQEGPAPLLVLEVLSDRTARERDLGEKLPLYSKLGINEYILVDPSGQFLPERTLLKRLQPGGTWKDFNDPDGGVTSELGFRVVKDEMGELSVVNAKTHKVYARPMEAQAEADARFRAENARRQAEEARLRAEEGRLQAEVAQRQAEDRATAEAEGRRQAEERIQALEEELRRLRENQK